MAGGTLFVSRAVNLHSWIKQKIEEFGFSDVAVTATERDGLSMLIRDLKPRIVLIGCKFYQCCTPFMVADLHRQFPKLNIAAVSITDFPDDLAMYFIVNGAKSYVNLLDGEEQFYRGMEAIREGREFISEKVQKRIEMRNVYPRPSGNLTRRQIEILRLTANGFTGAEIGRELYLSHGTVENSKSDIYATLNVRNEVEAVRVADYLGIIDSEELNFFGGNYSLRPKPAKNHRSY